MKEYLCETRFCRPCRDFEFRSVAVPSHEWLGYFQKMPDDSGSRSLDLRIQ